MKNTDKKLKAIAARLRNGDACEPLLVDSFLQWFGTSAIDEESTVEISQALAKHGLATQPDFTTVPLGETIAFIAVPAADCELPDNENIRPDPTLRISKLVAERDEPLSVKPDQPLEVAVTQMLLHNYSQLPVIIGRTIKGVISWKSIACRKVLAPGGRFVRDFMEKSELDTVPATEPLLSAARRIRVRDYVLVQASDTDTKITAILTGADIVDQFLSLAEPFLLLEEIEKGIRHLLGEIFKEPELAAAKVPGDESRVVRSIHDMTIGEYCRLIDNPEQWIKLGIQLDRAAFVAALRSVNIIRRKTMHFSQEKVTSAEIEELSEYARLLRKIREINESR